MGWCSLKLNKSVVDSGGQHPEHLVQPSCQEVCTIIEKVRVMPPAGRR
jgi:hypothetical protein